MPDTDHPTINDARKLAYTYRKTGVIILSFTGGTVHAASYGVTRAHCRAMADVADQIVDLIGLGEIAPGGEPARELGGEG